MVKIYRNSHSLCFKCMRITTLLIGIQACFATLLMAGKINAQNITIDVKQVSLKQVFLNIEKQSGVTFVYNEQTLLGLKPVTVKASNGVLIEVLKKITQQVPLLFKQSGNVIGVSRTIVKPDISDKTTQKTAEIIPPATIKGTVTNSEGVPLPGATVKVKGTAIATTTDPEGHYILNNVPEKSVLIVTFIGFDSREVIAADNLVIALVSSTSKLDEVHVIAYGTTTQRLNTGSTTKVTAEDIGKQPVDNPLAALQGRVAGLTVTQSSGMNGSSFAVELRGQTSFAGAPALARSLISTPLFIIDGIPFAPNNTNINNLTSQLTANTNGGGLSPFQSVNPADIESIEVLKDADATAIYGSRGGNGVILITTKKGKAGKTVFSANAYNGISAVAKLPVLMNSQQYIQMRTEAFKNDNVTPTVTSAPDLLVWDQQRYTDLPKLLIGGNAHATNIQTSISGGSNTTTFLISGAYNKETTVFPTDLGSTRANVHISLNHTSTDKKFSIYSTSSYSSSINTLPSANIVSNMTLEPNYPAFKDDNGNLVWDYKGVTPGNNPLAYLNDHYKSVSNTLISNMGLSYLIINGLTIKANLGYNTMYVTENDKATSNSINPAYASFGLTSLFGNNKYTGWSIEPQIEYTTNINKGKLTALGGATWQYNDNYSSSITGTGYTSDALLGSLSAAGSLSISDNSYQYKYQALFGRINYNWLNRYIINLTGRRDGSSRFGPDRQFGNFGALGGAWIFTNEDFAKRISTILSYGKLRGSYGITGTDQIANYQYLDSWSATTAQYQGSSGLYPSRLANPDYSWEKNKKLELALEVGLFKDRFLLTTAYYRNTGDNKLISYNLPSQTGFTTITENFPAVILNTGFEFTASSVNINKPNIKWTTSANITFPKNTLQSFPDIALSTYNNIYKVGQSLDIIQGYQYQGVDSKTGLFVFNDLDKNGVYNTNDYVNLGNFNPKFFGGIGNNITYKNWQLDFFFEFKNQLGRNYLNSVFTSTRSAGTRKNVPVELLDSWQQPGDDAAFRKYTTTNNGATLFLTYNSLTVSDASYMRLKNASLSFSLPAKWLQKLHLKGCNFTVQGQNLLTITRFKVTDPETELLEVLPPLRTITAGIQLTL